MFEELKKTASNLISGASKNDDGGSSSTGSNWLMHELLWRDFFRFITKKYSSPVQLEFPACTGGGGCGGGGCCDLAANKLVEA
ncbi:hypothetical protein ACJRO7_030406 [Eucalyptus globulus]|uniref:Uncharacterized protein n=1 Tax=Eucalyptus globulus TaxID=34317 RepID=A0ABD3JMA9_EUCGL